MTIRQHRDPTAGQRKSVPLTPADLRDLDLVRASPAALAAVGADPSVSESLLLHRLLTFGLRHATDVALDVGYSALALSYAEDPDEVRVRAAMRARRRVPDAVDA